MVIVSKGRRMIFSSIIQTLKQQWQRFSRWFSLHILRRSVGTVMPIFQDEAPAQLRRELEQIAVAVHDFRKLHSNFLKLLIINIT